MYSCERGISINSSLIENHPHNHALIRVSSYKNIGKKRSEKNYIFQASVTSSLKPSTGRLNPKEKNVSYVTQGGKTIKGY